MAHKTVRRSWVSVWGKNRGSRSLSKQNVELDSKERESSQTIENPPESEDIVSPNENGRSRALLFDLETHGSDSEVSTRPPSLEENELINSWPTHTLTPDELLLGQEPNAQEGVSSQKPSNELGKLVDTYAGSAHDLSQPSHSVALENVFKMIREQFLDLEDKAPAPKLAAEASGQLRKYVKLRQDEAELRERVYKLATEYTKQGVLAAPARLELMLAEENKRLQQLRNEITWLELELAREREAYAAAEAARAHAEELAIRQQRIEQLVADIRHKREQVRICEGKIRYLQRQQASLGRETPLHILNELRATTRILTSLQEEIRAQENDLRLSHNISAELLNDNQWLRSQVPALDTEDRSRFSWDEAETGFDARVLSGAPSNKVEQYRELRRREAQVRELAFLLARKHAMYGPVLVPQHLDEALAEERAKLEQLRAEITRLEGELVQSVREYMVAQSDELHAGELSIHQVQIERLTSDIRHKRMQAHIYEQNIRYLEEKRALMGLYTPYSIVNEIETIASELASIRAELAAQESLLQQDYGVSAEQLRQIEYSVN